MCIYKHCCTKFKIAMDFSQDYMDKCQITAVEKKVTQFFLHATGLNSFRHLKSESLQKREKTEEFHPFLLNAVNLERVMVFIIFFLFKFIEE